MVSYTTSTKFLAAALLLALASTSVLEAAPLPSRTQSDFDRTKQFHQDAIVSATPQKLAVHSSSTSLSHESMDASTQLHMAINGAYRSWQQAEQEYVQTSQKVASKQSNWTHSQLLALQTAFRNSLQSLEGIQLTQNDSAMKEYVEEIKRGAPARIHELQVLIIDQQIVDGRTVIGNILRELKANPKKQKITASAQKEYIQRLVKIEHEMDEILGSLENSKEQKAKAQKFKEAVVKFKAGLGVLAVRKG